MEGVTMANLALFATGGHEYLLIFGFLAVFAVIYLYFSSGRFDKSASVTDRSRKSLAEKFLVPENILFYQGHTWVRPEESEPDLVVVGMDDFAQKLAGPVGIRHNPTVGRTIRQGERGWSLQDGEKSIDMLAPISGEVVEINIPLLVELEKNINRFTPLDTDPYGKGWILKVRPEDFERERKGLLSGVLARKWMEEVANQLRRKMTYKTGAVPEPDGKPGAGIAKLINGDNWDLLLKEFFMT
jgi:glycine cleavage system H protein